jgi:hypothetical protein
MLGAGLTCQVRSGKVFVNGDLSDAVGISQSDLPKETIEQLSPPLSRIAVTTV